MYVIEDAAEVCRVAAFADESIWLTPEWKCCGREMTRALFELVLRGVFPLLPVKRKIGRLDVPVVLSEFDGTASL